MLWWTMLANFLIEDGFKLNPYDSSPQPIVPRPTVLTVRPDAPSVRVEASAPAEARTRHDGGVFGELEDGVGLWSRRPGRGLLLGRQDAKRGREAGPSITRRRIMVVSN